MVHTAMWEAELDRAEQNHLCDPAQIARSAERPRQMAS